MELPITAPGLLFPAISLLMLAYTNRFLALASLIRSLHDRYKQQPEERHIIAQIRNLRRRVRIIRNMQVFGIISFLLSAVCIFCIVRGWEDLSYAIFATSIISFVISLLLSLAEIGLSMKALEVELSDMERLNR